MKFFICLLICLILIFNLYGRELIIYYSSSLNGNLDGCTCKSAPKSGLVKRAYFLRNVTDRKNILLVDAGNILPVKKDKLLADAILLSYRELGYDLAAAGGHELLNGPGALLQAGDPFPFIGHNLSISTGNKYQPLTPNPVIVNKAGMKIGVIAVIDPKVFYFYPGEIKDRIQVTDPEKAVAGALADLETGETDLILLLFHGYLDKAREITEKYKQIDVTIVGHEQVLWEEYIDEDRIIVSPGEEGNRLGKLVLWFSASGPTELDNSFRHFDYEVHPDDPVIRQRIIDYQEAHRLLLQN